MDVEERLARKRLYKVTIGVLKIIPMLLSFCVVLNMFFDFLGIDSGIISTIGGISFLPLLFIYLASFAFGFCRYHRMFLHYIVANNVLTMADYYVGLPVDNVSLFMVHIFLVGLFLFLILYLYKHEKLETVSPAND